jgi:hypothetical protein
MGSWSLERISFLRTYLVSYEHVLPSGDDQYWVCAIGTDPTHEHQLNATL